MRESERERWMRERERDSRDELVRRRAAPTVVPQRWRWHGFDGGKGREGERGERGRASCTAHVVNGGKNKFEKSRKIKSKNRIKSKKHK